MSGTITKMRHSMTVLGAAAVVVLAGCQSGSPGRAPSATTISTAPSGPAGAFDVGGHKLDLACRGTGSPTVFFENGGNDDWTTWTVYGQTPIRGRPQPSPRIADAFASVRTCVYTRHLQRRGDPAPSIPLRTGADSVRDLHTLLEVAAVPGPYLLVGHSLGGLFAVMYAGTYPADVVGLVLLDPTLTTDPWWDQLPAPERAEVASRLATSREHIDIFATLAQAKLLVPHVPNIPVLLLAATRQEPDPDLSSEQMNQYIAGSRMAERRFIEALPRGELRLVDTGHYVHRDAPQLVVDEIQRIVEKTR
jgi:pimeloyl-ACP methyl ester carboxylesterase